MDEFVIKKSKKLYLKNGKAYLFNVEKLVEAMAKRSQVSTATIQKKLELAAEDENSKARTASRIMSFLRGNDDETISLNTAHLLGLAYGDSEMAFLEEVEIGRIVQALTEKENSRCNVQIKEIYRMLYEILYEMDESYNYNFVPDKETKNIDAFGYYEKRIDAVRKLVNTRLLDTRKIRQKLIQIIDETEVFVKSYSIPGVVPRWKKLNKKITYFDPVYDICVENYKLYKAVCNREVSIDNLIMFRFDFLPMEKDFEERAEYFASVAQKVDDGNLQYSYEKVFRNELLLTLEKVFEHDFPDLFMKE